MRILLIQPEYNYQRPVDAPSPALLILGTLAQNLGNVVKIIHLGLEDKPLFVELFDFKPDIVGITVNTFQVASAKILINTIREISKNIKIVIGGPHAEYLDVDVDERVIGEGENKWMKILGIKSDMNPVYQLSAINYGLVDLKRFPGIEPVGARPSVCIMASRGCPSLCTFCNTPIFWGTKVRLGHPSYVVNEIERLNKIWGVKEVVFQDDTFNASTRWATEILELIIKRQLDMVFRLVWRVNEKLVTQELLNLAKRAKVWNIYYGVESGSQMMLDRMKKGITIPEIKRAFDMTINTGITTHASFIVGLPGETKETIEETRKMVYEIKSTNHSWCYFIPFPGTEATREASEKGHIALKDYSKYGVGLLYARTDELDFSDLASFKGF